MHIMKLKRNELTSIIQHTKREHLHYSNENVDLTRSSSNVIHKDGSYKSLMKRLENVYIYGKNGKNRDNINYAFSICTHYPYNCPIPSRKFFDMLTDIFKGIFGNDNVIMSVSHYDEIREHNHCIITPVIRDNVKECDRLCFDKVITRDFLRGFHSQIEKEFAKRGYDVRLQNPEKVRGTKYVDTIEEYKRYVELKKQNKRLKKEYNDLIETIKSIDVTQSVLNGTYTEKITELQKRIDEIEKG